MSDFWWFYYLICLNQNKHTLFNFFYFTGLYFLWELTNYCIVSKKETNTFQFASKWNMDVLLIKNQENHNSNKTLVVDQDELVIHRVDIVPCGCGEVAGWGVLSSSALRCCWLATCAAIVFRGSSHVVVRVMWLQQNNLVHLL